MARRSIWAGVVALGVAGGAVAGPPDTIPPADTVAAPVAVAPSVAKVELAVVPLKGGELFPKMAAEARAAHSMTRDYIGFLVRQERVAGKLLAEQTAEVRVRVAPRCVNVKVVKPLALSGEETSYMPGKARTVRFKPAGIEGVRGFQTLPADHPKVLAHTRHPAGEVGLLAMLDRVERIVAVEAKVGTPAAITAAEFTFAGRPVTRFEVYADRQHPARYAPKCVLYVDKETKLPVRFEAYDAPKPGEAAGELIEVQSYVGLKFNQGLGDAAFER